MATAAGALLLAAIVGWAGYAGTRQALKRSDQNVALSLEVIGEVFDKLSDHDDPLPPPTGRAYRRFRSGAGSARGPRFRAEPGRGPLRDLGFGKGAPLPQKKGRPRSPADTPEGPPGPDGRLMGPPLRDFSYASSDNDTALLRSVLTFYERFAQRNEANPRLQGEAAWAHFKVEAHSAKIWAGSMKSKRSRSPTPPRCAVEDLAKRFPDVPEYRSASCVPDRHHDRLPDGRSIRRPSRRSRASCAELARSSTSLPARLPRTSTTFRLKCMSMPEARHGVRSRRNQLALADAMLPSRDRARRAWRSSSRIPKSMRARVDRADVERGPWRCLQEQARSWPTRRRVPARKLPSPDLESLHGHGPAAPDRRPFRGAWPKRFGASSAIPAAPTR